MLSETYLFTVKGESNEIIHMFRPLTPTPVGWIPPALIVMAARGSGGHRLYYLCGTNPYKNDRPCSEYPMEVDEVWASYNAGNLKKINVCDAAAELIREHAIAINVLREDGSIDTEASVKLQAERYQNYVVTVTCHGDTCSGHAEKLGVVATRDAADAIISDDKAFFIESIVESGIENPEITEKPYEVWYGREGENGRTYDVIEI